MRPPAPPQPDYAVVIPTLGRPCLQACLTALASASGPLPRQVVLVDDRRDTPDPLPVRLPEALAPRTVIVTLEGRGPAAARNAGWRASEPSEWVVFLDDDVQVGAQWAEELAADLADAPPEVAAVQACIQVPRPGGRRPTDWERGTIGLETAWWITADMAYRRAALADSGGFDERFPRAYREDSDLALRVQDMGWALRRGRRVTQHPPRPAGPWASARAQAGNADDAAMRRLHGPGWRSRAGASRGRFPAHVAACALGTAALALAAAGRRRPAARAAAGWLAMTAQFAAARIWAGPRTAPEIAAMAATSAAIPPLAVGHRLAGWRRWRDAGPWPGPPAAVLFDRDGTLIRDVPYNGNPALVEPLPGAATGAARLRAAGVLTGVVSNQSGVARGRLSPAQVRSVNERVDALLGPFDTWAVCLHGPADGCQCRKPAPGLILQAAAALGVETADCVVIGDIGADVAAARAAGARAVLVPRPATRAGERTGVPVAATVRDAVDAVLAGRRLPCWPQAGHTDAVSRAG